MAQKTRKLLEGAYKANGAKEMMEVFESGQRVKTKWNNIKPRSVEEEIKEIDLKTDNWN